MTAAYDQDRVVLSDVVGAEAAEALLEWLQTRPGCSVDLSGCTHLHPANLQVLMAARASVIAWPTDSQLAGWLQSAFRVP